MKRMIDSFIKNIVRQSLNENYGLLNEDEKSLEKCPAGGFCLNDGSLLKAEKLNKTLSPANNSTAASQLIIKLKSNCNNLNYGPANETIASRAVEGIGIEHSKTFTDENKVKRLINTLGFPEWCLGIELAQEKGYADDDNFWEKLYEGGLYSYTYVANPSLEVFRRTIKKTGTLKKDYDEKRSTDKIKWDEGLKKSGWWDGK
jgi:hypothetical protein